MATTTTEGVQPDEIEDEVQLEEEEKVVEKEEEVEKDKELQQLQEESSTFFSCFFTKIAYVVYHYPRIIIIIYLILSFLLLLGLLKVHVEFDQTLLWTSTNSEMYLEKVRFESDYGRFFGFIQIIGSVKSEQVNQIGSDVIQYKVLKELYQLEMMLQNVTFNGLSLKTECLYPKPGVCFKTSPLDFWKYNLAKIESTPDLKGDVSWRAAAHPLGFRINVSMVFGGIKYSPLIQTKIDSAEATLIFILLNSSSSLEMQEELERDICFYVVNFPTNYTRFTIGTNSAIKQEVENGLKGQWWLMPLSTFIMIAFVCLSTGSMSIIESRIGVSLFAVVMLFMSSLLSFSVSSLIGIPIAPITLQLLPSLLLSIGIDNMFIMTQTFITFQKETQQDSDLMALTKMLCHTGPSITMSSLSLCLVFGVCIYIDTPIIQTLCIQTCLAMAINYISQITVLSSVIVIDSQRVKAKRMDILCCIQTRKYEKASTTEDIDNPDEDHHHKNKNNNDAIITTPKNNVSFLTTTYVKIVQFIIGPITKYIVILIFVTLAINSSIMASRSSPGLPISSLVGPGNMMNFLHDQEIYFSSIGNSFFVVLPDYLNYSDWNTQKELQIFTQIIKEDPLVSSVDVWYNPFLSWVAFLRHSSEYKAAGNHIPPDKFYDWLHQFLSTEGEPLKLYFKFDEQGKIKSSRFTGNFGPLKTTNDLVEAYLTLKRLIKQSKFPSAYPFSYFFAFLAQFIGIYKYASLLLLVVSVCIFIICLLFLRNVILSFVAMVVVLITVIEMLAFQVILGLGFNAVSILVMASGIGLGIEYLVHVMYTFTVVPGENKEQKIINTAMRIGTPILFSVGSSIVGLSVLLFINFPLVRYYFGVLWIVLLFMAAFHALLLLPALFHVLTPPYPCFSGAGTQPSSTATITTTTTSMNQSDDVQHLIEESKEPSLIGSQEIQKIN